MRKRARDECTSINVIYDGHLEVLSQEENSADVLAQLPSLESIRSSLYRSRHEHTPILPIHTRDVSLSGRYTKTCSGEDFLLVDDGDDALVLGFTFDPLVIVSDFELVMVQASEMSFPNSYHRGCYYHFSPLLGRAQRGPHLWCKWKIVYI